MRLFFISFIFFLCQTIFHVAAQKKAYAFKHITADDGLSESFITSIIQDTDGFIWLGTLDGLNKYDGINFTTYRNNPKDSNSLGHNFVAKLFLDSKGNIWIGSHGGGLTFYDKTKNKFINYRNDPANPASISHNDVLGIDEDLDGNIWVGTGGAGINCLDLKTKKFKRFRHNNNDRESIASDYISDLLVDKRNQVWVATHNKGLDRLNASGSFIHMTHDPNNKTSISGNVLSALFEDKRGSIWIGTEGAGLNLYNPYSDSFIRFQQKEAVPGSLSYDYILSIAEDKKGNLWVGTENGGVSIYSTEQNKFTTIKTDEKDDNSINSNSIHAAFCDRSGNMWLGTYSGGVNFLSMEPEKFIHYKHDKFNKNSLNSNLILSLFLTDKNDLLIGTDGGGLNVFNLKNEMFEHFRHSDNPASISSDYVTAVIQDRDNDIWTGSYKGSLSLFNREKGTFINLKNGAPGVNPDISISNIIQDKEGYIWSSTFGSGIIRYDKKNKTFRHIKAYPEIKDSLQDGNVMVMYEDSKENIWVGTSGGGINILNKKNYTFRSLTHNPKDNTSLSHNNINCILEDSKHRLWVGTNDGLNLFDEAHQTFKSFFERDGLPNSVIFSIKEDNKGFLWIATNKGLSKFNPETMQFHNYTVSDGLQGNAFARNAMFKDKRGNIYVGGHNGFNLFHPDSITEKLIYPKVYITGFKLFNKSIQPGDKDGILKNSLRYTESITLDHRQSFLTFDFVALNYSKPEDINYAYKLEGFNDDWIDIGNNLSATYTNLNPGTYVFKVKASNNKGFWGKDETSIHLIIKPPFWMTWWFKTTVGVLILIIVFVIFKIRTQYITELNKRLADLVRIRTIEINNQKEEIVVQNQKLSEAYNDIQDSITYAKTIQDGMLENINSAYNHLNDLFIFFKPRDVVSGDFYWYAIRDEKIIIAAIDCTGHGVPGAFMSLIGNAVLNQIVNIDGVVECDVILSQLNTGVRYLMKQDKSVSKNGMDISLCVVDKKQKTLEFAGAVNPIVIIQNNTLTLIKGDNLSIAQVKEATFTKHVFDISIPTAFYLFSDGYQDQFGGPDNLKFSKRRLKDLLFANYQKPMDEQKEIIENTMKSWIGKHDQRDDMLIVGVRV